MWASSVVNCQLTGMPRALRAHPGFALDAPVQALRGQGRELACGDVEPAVVLGRVVPLLCVVHMRRTVRQRLQRMRQGRDRILPVPEDAAVLQGVVRLVQELPLWGG